MFGYIRTDVPEMRVRENEYYRAVYCGLCRAQGKCTGQCSRFTLNYDIVFLALLRTLPFFLTSKNLTLIFPILLLL